MDSTHKHNILKYSTTVYAIIPQLPSLAIKAFDLKQNQ